MNHSDLLREVHGFAKSKPVKITEIIREANGIVYSPEEVVFIQKIAELEKELKLPKGRGTRYIAKVLGRSLNAIRFQKSANPSYQELISKYPELAFESVVPLVVSKMKGNKWNIGKKRPRYSAEELAVLKVQVMEYPDNLERAYENTAEILERYDDVLLGTRCVRSWFQTIRDKPEHADWVPGVGSKEGGHKKARKNGPRREDGTYPIIPITSTKNYIIWLGGYTSTTT